MNHVDLETVRLFLHVLAATVWVGGQITLMLKHTLVPASGVTALLHMKASSRTAMAVFGALTGLTALATLFVGIMLAG